ncbi:MAG TPA: methylenetetrahydrofolate reductase [NAD(P)H] [Chloroflexota bacterium]|nr:methylenetetrahydrofolate reductase [NAD(P)H] [Chloroflexota bacterium]
MRIADIYAANWTLGRPTISFELFPPRTPEAEATLFSQALPALCALRPDFISVTYGAGGSTRDRTLGIVARARHEFGLEAMAHLTCVGASYAQLRGVLDEARGLGIENVLALRGDPPAGEVEFRPAPDGPAYAHELVRLVRSYDCFSVGVAGFPEGHIQCGGNRERDWAYLADKVAAGAEFVITQLFYDNADYFAFADHLQQRLGVRVPLVPGILPILSTAQIKRFTALCGARLPAPLLARLEALADDDEAVTRLGIEVATAQCRELLARGAPGLHFYTLNRARSVAAILANLGLTGRRPRPAARRARRPRPARLAPAAPLAPAPLA